MTLIEKPHRQQKAIVIIFQWVFNRRWASLVAQMIKNLPARQETQVRSLDQENLLEKEMATHSGILAWKNPMDRGALWAASPWNLKESGTAE